MSPETLIVETETVIAEPEPPIIELKNVEVTFTSRTGSLFKPNKVYAVRGVNMRIERGQTLGIVGESGCGQVHKPRMSCVACRCRAPARCSSTARRSRSVVPPPDGRSVASSPWSSRTRTA